MFEDLREYIEWLESAGKLHKVNKKVSSECEITEIVTRMIEKNGPTLLFENVDNNTIPVVANLFGSEGKICDALGVDNLQDLYKSLLGQGEDFNISISYEVQNEPKGIAQAIQIGLDWLAGSNCVLVLGDNLFLAGDTSKKLKIAMQKNKGAYIFGYKVNL